MARLLGAGAAVLSGTSVPGSAVRTPVRVGVDLGTASCVLVVLDAAGEPVWVDAHPSGALADGVVVDFARAIATVRALKQRAVTALGTDDFPHVATAYPPCIPVADARACAYVCEAAGFGEVALVDEVSAAQAVLAIDDGVVVDVGGGSTGVGVFVGGELVALDDRAGGGHHLDLVLAGALGIGVADAEPRKREHPDECLPILVPGLQRIAESVRAMTTDHPGLPLHLAGGALMMPGADRVLADLPGAICRDLPARPADHAARDRGVRDVSTPTLRTYAFIDRMQPQCAAHIAATSPGDVPLAGMAELYIEMAPGNEVFRAADIALKAAGVRPALQIIEREFGLLEIHSEQQAEVLASGEAVLAELGMSESDRIRPSIASTQFITNVHPYQAQLLNKWRKGSMLMPGQSLFVMEVAPAAYISIAANEAEKAADITVIELRAVGRFGRMFLSGTESDVQAARDAAVAALEAIDGQEPGR